LSSKTVARRYAGALADAVVAKDDQRRVQEELLGWQKLIASAEPLKQVFSNPTIPYDNKRQVLEELIKRTKIHQSTANFLRVLLRNQRLTELGEINKRFAQVLDERSGVLTAEVTTARPVSDETRQSLDQQLSSVSRKDVRLTFATDPELIGGIVTRIGSTVYDGSIRNQLQQIKKQLISK